MPVKFFSGKPGAGKSYFALEYIVTELRTTHRYIVTNLSIKIPELCQYLHDKYGDTFGAAQRIRLLQDEEVGRFWTCYGPGFDLSGRVSTVVHGKKQDHLDYAPRVAAEGPFRGVLYVLDEIHEHFNARRWSETGVDALHYLSQHRKLGDDVICITQHVDNVDKQFRSVCQDYTVLRNLRKEKVPILGGIFKAPSTIVRTTYLNPPGSGKQPPMESGFVKLDLDGLAKCYDTAAGVGLRGTTADTQVKAKGISFVWFFVALALIGVAILGLGRGVSSTLSGIAGKKTLADTNGTPVLHATAVTTPPAAATASVSTNRPALATNTPPAEVYISSIVVLPGDVTVKLTDGRVLMEHDITAISRYYVFAGTERFRLKGGGVIGMPAQAKARAAWDAAKPQGKAPVMTTHPHPVPSPAGDRHHVSTNAATAPGSSMIPGRQIGSDIKPAHWLNLPQRNGLAIP